MVYSHSGHGLGLDLDFLAVDLPLDFIPRLEFLLGIDSCLEEHVDGLGTGKGLDHLRDTDFHVQTSSLCFFLPFFGISVPVEADYVDYGCDYRLKSIHYCDLEFLSF